MYLPTNIIKLSKSNCNCKSGVNPEWNLTSVFNIAITDNINFDALVDTSDCNSIWGLLNQIRTDSIVGFELQFKLRFKDFARKVKGFEKYITFEANPIANTVFSNVPTFQNPIELIEKVATNEFYELAAKCVQELALQKLHEIIINSSEISRAVMMESEKSIIAAKVHAGRFEKNLNELCQKIPKKGIWRDLYFGGAQYNYR